jgi:hypothetical protein
MYICVCVCVYYVLHSGLPGGQRAADGVPRRAADGRTPRRVADTDTLAGATICHMLQGGTRAYAMGEGGIRREPHRGQGRFMYQQFPTVICDVQHTAHRI